jgi:hypothetical protein
MYALLHHTDPIEFSFSISVVWSRRGPEELYCYDRGTKDTRSSPDATVRRVTPPSSRPVDVVSSTPTVPGSTPPTVVYSAGPSSTPLDRRLFDRTAVNPPTRRPTCRRRHHLYRRRHSPPVVSAARDRKRLWRVRPHCASCCTLCRAAAAGCGVRTTSFSPALPLGDLISLGTVYFLTCCTYCSVIFFTFILFVTIVWCTRNLYFG